MMQNVEERKANKAVEQETLFLFYNGWLAGQEKESHGLDEPNQIKSAVGKKGEPILGT